MNRTGDFIDILAAGALGANGADVDFAFRHRRQMMKRARRRSGPHRQWRRSSVVIGYGGIAGIACACCGCRIHYIRHVSAFQILLFAEQHVFCFIVGQGFAQIGQYCDAALYGRTGLDRIEPALYVREVFQRYALILV
jgi:hypothetical protein